MINNLVRDYAQTLEKPTEEYLRGVFNKLCDMYDYSCLPERFLVTEIDNNKIPKKLKILIDDIVDVINGYDSVGVRLPDFKYGGYVTSKLLYTYILNQLKLDKHIKSFLYIDTDIFMRDLKRFMNKDEFEDVGLALEYSKDTLFRSVYDADFVFWDKFNVVNSNYELGQLNEILTRRYNHLKGNLYFGVIDLDANINKLFSNVDMRTAHLMNLTTMYDLSKDKYNIVNIEEYRDGK